MARKSGSVRSARTNAIVTTVSVLGILVMLNVLGLWVFGKVDLTDNQRYTLSDVSIRAVRDLDPLDVQVFISEDLPPTVSVGWGRERDIRGVARELVDKLEEYQSYSGGAMRITRVKGDIEEKARKAKLELFTGKEAAVQGGMLEFKKYAVGVTFQYRNQMEVFPLALEPEYFEFEITKRLLRLKEKYEKSAGIKDVLDAGKALYEAAKSCNDKLASYEKQDGSSGGGLGALLGGGAESLSALRMDKDSFKAACAPVVDALAKAGDLKGRNEYLDQLAGSGNSYAQMVDELGKLLDDPKSQDRRLAAVVDRLKSLFAIVERDHDLLENSPGRKYVGFLCGHEEFCPFASKEPLIRPEIAGLMGQRNPLVQQFVNQARQIEEQIDNINEQIRRGVFTRRGLSIKRVESGEDIPDDVEVLVVHGPRKDLSERDLYNIDQFLLSGRSVIFFLKNWDVAVYNIGKRGESFDMRDMRFDELAQTRLEHPRLDEFLEHYGIKVHHDLVMEPRNYEAITIIQVQKQGQFTLQSQRAFPYPLLPTFEDMDRAHVLVRRLSNVTLPYVSSMEPTEAARGDPKIDVVELIRSSPDAVATDQKLRLSPPELVRQLAGMQPNGPHTVAVVLKGEFDSYFKDREIPKPTGKKGDDSPGKADADRPFRERGSGRILVVGSDMGLENLSAKRVFEGFSMAQLTSGTADFFMKLKDYVANFQNWQLRLSQIAEVVQSDLDFVFNCLDWGVQKEELVDIRSKGLQRRPIATLSQGAQTALTFAMVIGIPALFVFAGMLRFALRRKRS